jgi:hypothetical protein
MKILFALVTSLLVLSPALTKAAAPQARLDEAHRAFFKSYCVECHNADKQKGKLRLDDISFSIDSIEKADRWQKILNSLNSGEMPPDDAKQPDKAAKTEFLDKLSRTLVTARNTLGDQGGKITMRRLNRREYKNTIRDLLGIEIDVRDLPADGGSGTFDTVGGSLFMSSDQFEQYLTLARKALDEVLSTNKVEKRIERREAEELAKRVVRGTYGGYYLGGYKSAMSWKSSDRSKPPKDFGLPDENEVNFRIQVFHEHAPSFCAYLANPLSDTGALLTIYNVHPEEVIALPPDSPSDWDKTVRAPVPTGNYMLRLRVGQIPKTPKERAFLEMGTHTSDGSFASQKAFQITGTVANPQLIEVPVTITKDSPRSFAFREKRPLNADQEIYSESQKRTGIGPDPVLWVDWVEWEGPLPDPARTAIARRILENPGDAPENAQARTIIQRFATRTFRDKAPEPEYLEKLVKLFADRRQTGESFTEALKEPLSVVLASPGFLYLSEPGTEKTPRQLTDLELATRLSYFLWSAPPDETLFDLARRGELHKPEILAQQVNRLIADGKAKAFAQGFTHQWLGLPRLDFFQFNTKLYRDFDESTKAAARDEVYHTFAHLLRNGGSLSRLLKSDHVIINAQLANYYGIEGVKGDEFRQVSLPAGSPRGGLLGMAAILAMGSNGEHTSPVERGAWVLRKLLHDPPPPAPPNVPQLTRLEGKLLTTRERLLAHQEEPQCASCHRKIDPIGFGLENFDAVGKWRTEDSYEKKGVGKKTWPVEPAAAFYNGPAFKDYFELRDLIAAKPERFARGFTEALIEYALGRPYGFTDEDMAADIVKQAQGKNFTVREFIQALVASKAFQTK